MIEFPLMTAVSVWFTTRIKGWKSLVPIGMWLVYAILEFGIIV